MGYEVQMLVGVVHENMKGYTEETKDKGWFQIYAAVDLCKPGPTKILELKDAAKADPVYVYAIMGDGDTMTIEDRYGAPVVPMPIRDVLEALHTDQRNEHYRRFSWAIALLESMVNEEQGQLSVAFWGF